jgi:hypothetical protein
MWCVESRYQAMYDEDTHTAEWEDFVYAVVWSGVRELAITLQLIAVKVHKSPINLITNLDSMFSHLPHDNTTISRSVPYFHVWYLLCCW